MIFKESSCTDVGYTGWQIHCSFDLMYLSDIKGESMKTYAALACLYVSPLLNGNQMWPMVAFLLSSFHSATDGCGPGASRMPEVPARACRLLAASGSHGSIVLNTVINHTRTGGHVVLNTASHPHKCRGASARAQRTLCTSDTRVIVRRGALLGGETRW